MSHKTGRPKRVNGIGKLCARCLQPLRDGELIYCRRRKRCRARTGRIDELHSLAVYAFIDPRKRGRKKRIA